MTPNKEDYLKCIYEIGTEEGKISNKEIANRMQVSPPAVTEMIKKLISEDLIVKDKHKGYLLTETGTINVAELYRKHRLIEVFLVDHLQYTCDLIHQEAEILEHTVSDHFINALDRLLNYPQTCPHGGQIPKSGQLIEEIYNQTFTQDLTPGDYVLRRVQDQIDLLHYLETVGLKIGVTFLHWKGFDPFTQLYRLNIDGKEIQIPELLLATFILNQTKKARLMNTLRSVISLTLHLFQAFHPF